MTARNVVGVYQTINQKNTMDNDQENSHYQLKSDLMANKSHVMIDIETMGHTTNAPITSIGCVQFDMFGNFLSEFEVVINLETSMEAGCVPDASTIYWWLNQSYDARKFITRQDKVSIQKALGQLTTYLTDVQPKRKSLFVWANSPSFDCSILRNSYKKVGLKPYWVVWNEMDLRTFTNFEPDVKKDVKQDNTGNTLLHTPVEDCKMQIKILTSILC